MNIDKVKGTWDSNTYICEDNGKILIIDSGADTEEVVKKVNGREVVGILITHEHFDHIMNAADYAKAFKAPIYGATEVSANIRYYKTPLVFEADGKEYPIAQADDSVEFKIIETEDAFEINDFKIKPYFMPGHSAGSIVYIIDDNIWTGDVLFDRFIGNHSMFTNGKKYMIESLTRLKDIKFQNAYFGHGESTDYSRQQKNISLWLKWLSR